MEYNEIEFDFDQIPDEVVSFINYFYINKRLFNYILNISYKKIANQKLLIQ